MLQGKSFLAVVTARGGSKGIKDKNIVPVLGRPLLYYCIKAAMDSHIFDRIVVSTDSERIAHVACVYGVDIIERPIELAQDDTPSSAVMAHALRQTALYDYVQLLEPTSPLVLGTDILKAAKYLLKSKCDLVIGITKSRHQWIFPLGKDNSIRGVYPKELRDKGRQYTPEMYFINGCIYVGKWDVFYHCRDFYEVDVRGFVMHPNSSWDINYYEDVIEVERRLRNMERARMVLNG